MGPVSTLLDEEAQSGAVHYTRLFCHLAPVSEKANVSSWWPRIPLIPTFGVSDIFVFMLGKKEYLWL